MIRFTTLMLAIGCAAMHAPVAVAAAKKQYVRPGSQGELLSNFRKAVVAYKKPGAGDAERDALLDKYDQVVVIFTERGLKPELDKAGVNIKALRVARNTSGSAADKATAKAADDARKLMEAEVAKLRAALVAAGYTGAVLEDEINKLVAAKVLAEAAAKSASASAGAAGISTEQQALIDLIGEVSRRAGIVQASSLDPAVKGGFLKRLGDVAIQLGMSGKTMSDYINLGGDIDAIQDDIDTELGKTPGALLKAAIAEYINILDNLIADAAKLAPAIVKEAYDAGTLSDAAITKIDGALVDINAKAKADQNFAGASVPGVKAAYDNASSEFHKKNLAANNGVSDLKRLFENAQAYAEPANRDLLRAGKTTVATPQANALFTIPSVKAIDNELYTYFKNTLRMFGGEYVAAVDVFNKAAAADKVKTYGAIDALVTSAGVRGLKKADVDYFTNALAGLPKPTPAPGGGAPTSPATKLGLAGEFTDAELATWGVTGDPVADNLSDGQIRAFIIALGAKDSDRDVASLVIKYLNDLIAKPAYAASKSAYDGLIAGITA